jgi:hypothetical protein
MRRERIDMIWIRGRGGNKFSRRTFLEAAAATSVLAAAPITVSSVAGAAGSNTGAGAGGSTPALLEGYVYGTLTGATNDTVTIDAPGSDGSTVSVAINYNDATVLNGMGNLSSLSNLPVGTRIEAASIQNPAGQTLTSRTALWVNVNAIYSHGDVLGVQSDSGTVSLQQAHGGSQRTLHVPPGINAQNGGMNSEDVLSGVQVSDHLFFTGFTYSSDTADPDVEVVTLQPTSLNHRMNPNVAPPAMAVS